MVTVYKELMVIVDDPLSPKVFPTPQFLIAPKPTTNKNQQENKLPTLSFNALANIDSSARLFLVYPYCCQNKSFPSFPLYTALPSALC